MKATEFPAFSRDRFKHSLRTLCRSSLALLLAFCLTFSLNWGEAMAAKTNTVSNSVSTYTPAQLEQIKRYLGDVEELRERMLKIPGLVQRKRWTDVQSYVHGPLGALREEMSRLTRSLAPDVQPQAREAAKDIFGHLIKIDEAAKAEDSRQALRNYNGAIEDFEIYLNLLPPEVRA